MSERCAYVEGQAQRCTLGGTPTVSKCLEGGKYTCPTYRSRNGISQQVNAVVQIEEPRS